MHNYLLRSLFVEEFSICSLRVEQIRVSGSIIKYMFLIDHQREVLI